MSKNKMNILMDILKKEVVVATGCTEPVAVAYSAAVAKQKSKYEINKVEIWVDPGVYKNGARVGIPGIKERGLEIASALGLVTGDPSKGLRVIDRITEEDLEKAKAFVDQGKVKVFIKEDRKKLYIETILYTENEQVRVVTMDKHLNIVNTSEGQEVSQYHCDDTETVLSSNDIQKFDLEDFVQFCNEVPLSEIQFLEDGVKLNLELAKEGLKIPEGIGGKFKLLVKSGIMSDNIVSNAQIMSSSASEARMAGSKLPAMSSAGSGNHGITVFMTNYAVAQKNGISNEKLLRALALSNLVTVYIKSYTGALSAMCGCGIAAGIGASTGVVYLLGGSSKEMLGAIINMVGSISGLLCDGGKEGCAYKLALSAGWAVQSSLLALEGAIIDTTNGILASDFNQVIKNLGYVCCNGMVDTNKVIISVMNESV